MNCFKVIDIRTVLKPLCRLHWDTANKVSNLFKELQGTSDYRWD
jgi:hypothetical protein